MSGAAICSLCAPTIHADAATAGCSHSSCPAPAPAVGLLCSGGAPPEDQQAGLAASLQRSCVTFVTLCHACTAAAGPSLKEGLVKLAQDVIHPCLALVKDMVSSQPHHSPTATCMATTVNTKHPLLCSKRQQTQHYSPLLVVLGPASDGTTVCPALL